MQVQSHTVPADASRDQEVQSTTEPTASGLRSTTSGEREPDILDKLADDIKRDVQETCAKIAEIHHVKPVGGFIRGSYMDGYNTAVSDIAAKIREL